MFNLLRVFTFGNAAERIDPSGNFSSSVVPLASSMMTITTSNEKKIEFYLNLLCLTHCSILSVSYLAIKIKFVYITIFLLFVFLEYSVLFLNFLYNCLSDILYHYIGYPHKDIKDMKGVAKSSFKKNFLRVKWSNICLH